MLGDARRVPGGVAVGEHVADVWLVDHVGAAVVFDFREADVDVDAEGLGDFLAEVLAECAAGDAADDLAEDEPEAHHVVALGGAGRATRVRLLRYAGTPSPSRASPIGVSRMRGPMTPERWPSTMATVMSCFPACANSGQ